MSFKSSLALGKQLLFYAIKINTKTITKNKKLFKLKNENRNMKAYFILMY